MKTAQLVIIGSGPAGYTAALYAARARLEPKVFTGIESGGQLMYTTQVENYPGFPEGILGPKLMADLRAQAAKFGAVIEDAHVTAVDLSARPFKLWAQSPWTSAPDLLAQSLIICTGATAITLKVPGEKTLIGRGVSTCAVCDAAFYREKTVFVVGGGDSAMEDSLALTKFASRVTIIHRRDSFRASKIMIERVLKNDKIKVLWNSTLQAIKGKAKVEGITINENGQIKDYPADGLFYAIGHRPVTDLFQGQLELDQNNYIVTAQSPTKLGAKTAAKRVGERDLITFPTMTSVEGVFAAGDVVDVRYRQAVIAAGMGSAAAMDTERWLEDQK